ncbi:MAG TPA: hypothetical protein VHE61_21440 [Opitutaceae bacterium]|nr:hypothetical protein [Opitutaceae bacterium]
MLPEPAVSALLLTLLIVTVLLLLLLVRRTWWRWLSGGLRRASGLGWRHGTTRARRGGRGAVFGRRDRLVALGTRLNDTCRLRPRLRRGGRRRCRGTILRNGHCPFDHGLRTRGWLWPDVDDRKLGLFGRSVALPHLLGFFGLRLARARDARTACFLRVSARGGRRIVVGFGRQGHVGIRGGKRTLNRANYRNVLRFSGGRESVGQAIDFGFEERG